ncbi:MAG: nucleoside triphosphate pyrophosphohydrolase [Oligoflexia bacterium]|nr:nucleoside triphosphate pyrophosphohydrolase [Oligoflexia bacterium]MBF0364582.1 nucleoside triphosphate pyrophosphohydrolase [Oligoflexia bacterium]
MVKYPELERLIAVVEYLRDPEKGCPWDLKQTHHSLLKHLIEEAYEFVVATECEHVEGMKEELGDLLLQILLHTTIAKESGVFDLEAIAKGLADKLIYRHEHVFGKNLPSERLSASEALKRWDAMKSKEKAKEKLEQKQLIDETYLSFPGLLSAYKIGKRSHKIDFDWGNLADVVMKVEEEWSELKAELLSAEKGLDVSDNIEEELGDFLFTVSQLSRHLDLNPEECLRKANLKFFRRFQVMQNLIAEDGGHFLSLDMESKEKYWERAKRICKGMV